jgi:methionine biosynthesis protein MetW
VSESSPGFRPASTVSEYYERYWLPPESRPPDVTRPQLFDTPFPAVGRLFDQRIPAAARCLDVGCGHGRAAGRPLTATGRTYVGVDISATAVAEARSFGLDARQIDDAASLPFAEGEFDAVLCLEVLEHVFFPAQVVAEMVRVLKPGGCLIVTTPNVAYWRRRVDLLLLGRWNPFGYSYAVEQPWGDPHIRFFTAGALRRLLTSAGLEGVEVAGHGGSVIGDIPWIGRRLRKREGSPAYRLLESRLPSLFGCFLNAVGRKPELTRPSGI